MRRSVQLVNSCLCLIALARLASATTYFPCSPVLLANPQGRPLANATVSILNTDGTDPGPIKLNAAGSQQFMNVLPANQILQVFMNPGIYSVQVSGEGITKLYTIVCGTGYGASVGKVSVDRTADLVNINTSKPPMTTSQPQDEPFLVIFGNGEDTYGTIDFMMPKSFGLTLNRVQLSWRDVISSVSNTSAVWSVAWCVYDTGQPVCDIASAVPTLIASPLSPQMKRVDAVFLGDLGTTGVWTPNTHVLMAVGRKGTDPRDTFNSAVGLENIQLEFDR